MPHGKSWLNLLPGVEQLLHWLEAQGKGWLFGSAIHAQHILAIILVSLLMFALAVAARRQLQQAGTDILPDPRLSARTLVELLLEGLLTIMQFTMPRTTALRHLWLVGTLAFFILFSNLLGLIPGMLPPTENFNTTFACASMVFVYYNLYAFRRLGLGHLAHMANPVGETWGWFLAPLFLPVELISHCIRPVSLSIRLLCNMAGDHLVLGVFIGIFPWLLPLPFMALGLFVSVVQVFVFTLLSCVYISEVEANIEHHLAAHGHHGDGHGHEGHETKAFAH